MKILISLFLMSFQLLIAEAQNPLVKEWDRGFGGKKAELLQSIHQTKDGGYILGGFTNSDSSGDISSIAKGNYDIWIIRVDSLGQKIWESRFGCDKNDELYCITETPDKGFIIGAESESGICADKSSQSNKFQWSYPNWIIKIDSLGKKEWDKVLGDSFNCTPYSILNTIDGGYLIAGIINGDYWLTKINHNGKEIWHKYYGGSDLDGCTSIISTSTGYLLAGTSRSDSCADKSQNSWYKSDTTTSPNTGKDTIIFSRTEDFWVIMVDSLGNKLWDKRYGGTGADKLSSATRTFDAGFILAGISNSNLSGDKTKNSIGGDDYWLVRIDSIGNKIWDKTYGTSDYEEYIGSVCQTSDSGFIVAGRTESNINGDKTENNLGLVQTWLVKTDKYGNKQWDKTIFSPGYDNTSPDKGFALEIREGIYLTANYTTAGIGGYKSQPSLGGNDYWMVRFRDSTLISSLNQPIKSNQTITIFPNPASEILQCSILGIQNKRENLIILNILGEPFIQQNDLLIDNGVISVDVSNLANGLYFIKITDGISVHTAKFMKRD